MPKRPFFIGYAGLPAGLRWFMAGSALALLCLGAGVALGLGLAREEGASTRFVGRQVVVGIFQAHPYPLLYEPASQDYPQGRTVLLTGNPKFGIFPEIASALDGAWVEARGARLVREDHDILIIFNQRTRLTTVEAPDGGAAFRPPEPVVLGERTLQGEIVDTKCFFGAMKPGQGRVHKGCAIACLRGGIPPSLAVPTTAGFEAFLLLDHQGNPLPEATWGAVAAPVAIRGTAERWGDLSVLKVAPDGIEVL
ncbi:MAG: hypothetical protein ACFCBW_09895 [Candidatus Competibacterales bacterium]